MQKISFQHETLTFLFIYEYNAFFLFQNKNIQVSLKVLTKSLQQQDSNKYN